MTEIWFYVSDDGSAGARARLLQRLLERAAQSDRQLYLHCSDEQGTRRLDDWLWQAPASFVPHGIADTPDGDAAGIVLGHGPDPGERHDMLVNLADDVPDFFSRFRRVVELVSGDENDRARSRARWKFYRDRGYPVTRHELS